jgi:hypothetical protein
MCLRHTESESPHLIEDLVGGLDPSEGEAAFVVGLDVGEPRRVGRREMKLKTGMLQSMAVATSSPMAASSCAETVATCSRSRWL